MCKRKKWKNLISKIYFVKKNWCDKSTNYSVLEKSLILIHSERQRKQMQKKKRMEKRKKKKTEGKKDRKRQLGEKDMERNA